MKFVIRDAALEDAGEIAEIHVASWRSTYGGMVAQETLDALSVDERAAMWRSGLAKASRPEFLLVAELPTGRLAGFASGGPERSGHPEYKGELFAIYLLEEHLRAGIGSALVREVMKRLRAQDIPNMIMWMLKDNPNRAFAERLGGVNVASKKYQIGNQDLEAIAYAWKDFTEILEG